MLMFVAQMNFISHYHFYKKDDNHYHLGLILPDLIKSICRTHYKSNGPFVNRIFHRLDEGCITHLNSDKIFHQSAVFEDIQNHLSEQLDEASAWPRKWFFNHIMTEILIDRVIMEKHPNECFEFYREIESIDENQLELFLKMNHIPNYQNFRPGFQNFVKNRFLFEYMNNEKLLFALSRVYSRIGIQYEFTKNDYQLLEERLENLLYYIDLQYDTLKKQLIVS